LYADPALGLRLFDLDEPQTQNRGLRYPRVRLTPSSEVARTPISGPRFVQRQAADATTASALPLGFDVEEPQTQTGVCATNPRPPT
jgi:hypothetical protein